ncbi:MAG: TlpA family protein disulfide reductase [Akkermansiaceae bacterium]
MESYNTHIFSDSSVELIQLSFDHDLEKAEEWAREAGLAWPTILMEDIPDEIRAFSPRNAVPDYVLVSAEGEVVASGKEAAFDAIKRRLSE